MPWYSLITVTADGTVKQGPAVEGTSTSILTKNAQQYINSYQRTLENQGIEGVRVRACIKSELDSELPSTLTTAQKESIRNPGKQGYFWIDEAGSSDEGSYVWVVRFDGYLYRNSFQDIYELRPVLEIN